ncbi:MAG TPA: GNAT family N-acetyltransferase [Steroidobacteraceae bacterium]|nr:GNAT family N-acetyltransferase [Steroidobacteraceae bacterium]
MNVLESARLRLRRLDPSDAGFILELLNEPAFLRYIGDKGVRTLSDAREYIEKGPLESYRRCGFGLYLTSLGDGTPIGICGLVKRDGLADVDVGFALRSRYWSQGYAAEAAAAVLDYARRGLLLRRIVAIAAPDNHASICVLEKIGMKFECMVRLRADGPELKMFATPAQAVSA